MRSLTIVAALGLMLATSACDRRVASDAGPPDAGERDSGPPDAGAPEPFALTSLAFEDGGAIATRYQCGPPLVGTGPGENVSPALTWTAGPAGTTSYAVVVRDRSAGDLVHWVIYDLPPTTRELPEGVPAGYEAEGLAPARQAQIQTSGYFGYFGPCSGGRGNTYEYAVHALPTATLESAAMGTADTTLAAAVEEQAIASASITGIW